MKSAEEMRLDGEFILASRDRRAAFHPRVSIANCRVGNGTRYGATVDGEYVGGRPSKLSYRSAFAHAERISEDLKVRGS